MSITPHIIPIAALTLLLVLACGPTPADDSSGSGTAGGSASTSGSTVAPTTSGADNSTTAVSTTALSTSMASASGGSTAGESFIVISDGGCGGVLPDGQKLRCSFEDCDPIEQNCGPGEKCVPWASSGGSWDADRCVPVTGDGHVGDPCTVTGNKLGGFDDCALGHICWNVDDELHGTCIAQCTGTHADPQCPEGSTCVIANSEALTLCLPICDPLKQDCQDGDVCIPNFMGPGFVCALDASVREGQANDPCDYINECDPGLLCADPTTTSSACPIDSNGCCTPFCSFPGGACPNPDQQCVSFFAPDPPPPGDEDIGVCKIP